MSSRDKCKGCGLPVGDYLYRADDHILCSTCMTLIQLGIHPKNPFMAAEKDKSAT